MRWIFYTLLIINVSMLFYITWTQYRENTVVELISDVLKKPDVTRSLVLLSEQQTDHTDIASVRIGSSAQSDQAVKISRSLCSLVGAFPNVVLAETFSQKLSGLGVKSKVKNLLVSSTVGYWLHLPPLSSRKEVLRRLRELQRQGVDSYVIPDGDLQNGISLGMFSEKQRAEELKKDIQGLGYRPEVLSVPRERRELWVFLEQSEADKISSERWLTLLSGKDLLQKQQNSCSDVASS